MPDETKVVIDITGANEMADPADFFRERLYADRDRHSANATSFEKVLEMQYAQSMQFRDANAARIVMEAGSGRTRSESNGPNNTAAQTGT